MCSACQHSAVMPSPLAHCRLQYRSHSLYVLSREAFCAAATLTATYNDLDSVRQAFEANKDEIAGVILEPVVGNSGFIPPTKEFLEVMSICAPHRTVALKASPAHPS